MPELEMRRLRVLPRKLGEQGGDARMRITDHKTGSAAHDLGACMLPDRDHAAFLVFWGATWDLHGRPNAASLGAIWLAAGVDMLLLANSMAVVASGDTCMCRTC